MNTNNAPSPAPITLAPNAIPPTTVVLAPKAAAAGAATAKPATTPTVAAVLVRLKPFSSQNRLFTKFLLLFNACFPISPHDKENLDFFSGAVGFADCSAV